MFDLCDTEASVYRTVLHYRYRKVLQQSGAGEVEAQGGEQERLRRLQWAPVVLHLVFGDRMQGCRVTGHSSCNWIPGGKHCLGSSLY